MVNTEKQIIQQIEEEFGIVIDENPFLFYFELECLVEETEEDELHKLALSW